MTKELDQFFRHLLAFWLSSFVSACSHLATFKKINEFYVYVLWIQYTQMYVLEISYCLFSLSMVSSNAHK